MRMKTPRLTYPAIALLLLCAAAAPGPGQVPAAVDLKDVAFTAEQLGGPTLPYQAVRIRFTLRNISNKQLGPLFGTDVGGNLVYGIKGPEDDQYQKHGVIIVYERIDHRNTSVSTAREHFNSEIPLFLRPGQETSHSVAFGRWSDRDYKPQVAFPIPGTYTLKCGYLVDGQKNKHV